ncbi:GMC oxidoreductase [Euzebya sp.]|uniref:GMC oxidoreductase n=1 Tax=Euzebya sp. TaxID=1971409 RepID=UPI0035152FD3
METDVAIIGSGFGGSVSALRLAEKGYDVTVVEEGRRWTAETLPASNRDLRKFFWFPSLGLRGAQRMTLLKDVFILSGAAVGGGSVIYANTLYEPLEGYWHDPAWAAITDWRDELAPHYDQAKRMLGVTTVPFDTPADELLLTIGRRMGVEDTFHKTDVGVWFGTPGETVGDPYFGGRGPDRTGCIRCGNCMVGCRHGAKNSLDQNYLHLAEQLGARVVAERRVVDLRRASDGRWALLSQRPGTPVWRRPERTVIRADHVIFAAGSLGTQKLLHRFAEDGPLDRISPRLGSLTRTNSEAIVGASAGTDGVDYSQGIAITGSIHVDEHTHIENVRYGRGSDAMRAITAPMVDGGGAIPRPLRFLLQLLTHPLEFLRNLTQTRWSERTVPLLVMQSLDNSLQTLRRRTPFGSFLTTRQAHGTPNPTWIPAAHTAARFGAEAMGGIPVGSIFEATLNVPTTAHIIGGAPIGETAADGVIDPYHRLHGHDGLHVVDGSAITANLGVNPSLSITAMAERAMSLWPNAGEPDPRPPLGAPYRRVAPVAPRTPAVPADAPAALRQPASA